MTQQPSRRPHITALPKRELCTHNTNGRLSGEINPSPTLKKRISPAQNIAPTSFSNTTASFTTSSGFKTATLITPQTIDAAGTSALSTATNPSATQGAATTSGPSLSTTRSNTALSWAGGSSLKACTLVSVSFDTPCYPLSTTTVGRTFPTNSTSPPTGPASTGAKTALNIFPILIPSAVIVVCVLIFSVVGSRRKWITRAYQHLYRERRIRHGASLGAPLDPAEANDNAIPLRDLETPPPPYSPYDLSIADRAFLGLSVGVPYPTESSHGAGSESNAIGLSYPLGNRRGQRSS